MTNKITVHIRLRDIPNGKNNLWQVENNTLYQIVNKTTKLSYSCYQNVFQKIKTKDVYNTCIKEIIAEFTNGKNCTIFAYGQTGSGKTYTMLGSEDEPGIIKLSLIDILKIFPKIEISYLEIYNENVRDLINLEKNVKIYAVGASSFVTNITKIEIRSMKEALSIIEKCEKKRKIGQTESNERSSRSHTVFQIYISINGKIFTLNLIDLAGSERASGSVERRKEGSFINKSLLALGTVVNKLIKNEYVNFRDSKLTRILQQSLDGNSNVVSLCMINSNEECLSESISTLKFAARLSKIELKDRAERMVQITEDEKPCGVCKCCRGKKEENKIRFEDIMNDVDVKSEEANEINKCNLDDNDVIHKKEIEEYKNSNIILKAENDLYLERIKNLEDTILNLMDQKPNKRINDLFVLEKNMFQLQLEIIKRKKK